jgi:hypothetical protein
MDLFGSGPKQVVSIDLLSSRNIRKSCTTATRDPRAFFASEG